MIVNFCRLFLDKVYINFAHFIELFKFIDMYQMHQIQLRFKGQNQKITAAKSLSSHELQKLIATSFNINEKVIGVTDRAGKFFELSQLLSQSSATNKGIYSLVTAKDLNQQSMSFASEYYQQQGKAQFEEDQETNDPTLEIPTSHYTKCLGIISDIDFFEEMFLVEGKVTVVASFTKIKPTADIFFQYYLFQNELKNSVTVYSGKGKICEFYVNDWNEPNPEIGVFIQGLIGQNQNIEESQRSGQFKKRSKIGEGEIIAKEAPIGEQQIRDVEVKQSLLQNLNKLLQDGDVSELQFYKLKSKVLEDPHDFVRTYQMGTRLGLRGDVEKVQNREVASKEEYRGRGRSANRARRYEIPIIVRKYNNVVQKISTSYPLTLEQEQAINLILELELKGLISEKEAGQVKSLVLQEDVETFKLFSEYFDETVDQIELASRLKKKRGSAGREESRERVEHDMRLLIKHAKQNSYELLRKLALEQNRYVLGAMEAYRSSKNVEQLSARLQKIACFYRAKQDLEELSSQ